MLFSELAICFRSLAEVDEVALLPNNEELLVEGQLQEEPELVKIVFLKRVDIKFLAHDCQSPFL